MPTTSARRRRTGVIAAAVAAGALTLAACGSSSSTTSPQPTHRRPPIGRPGGSTPATGSASAAGGQILPVTSNPITNTATAQTLTIDSVLVENNVDSTGAATDDHLEIALTQHRHHRTRRLRGVLHLRRPDRFDHRELLRQTPRHLHHRPPAPPASPTSTTPARPTTSRSTTSASTTRQPNALDVTVVVSATDAAPQTATVQKDAGGAETAD